MMGRREREQGKLFYEFNLDEMVPRNHLLRRINVVVTAVLADLHDQLKPFYSDIGRPSVDPELMIRMLIVGYCYGIRHERKLCDEVALHLAYRWFCKMDLEDKVPHHSTFSVNRLGRFRESDILRHIFERVVAACMAAGLVKGDGFAVDASVMEANASRYHGVPPDEISWTVAEKQKRAVAEYLDALASEAEQQDDASDKGGHGDPPDQPGDPSDDRSDATAPETPRQRRSERKAPKVISPSDPFSAWTAKANKRVQFGYGLNYLIDVEHAVIVEVEATPARTFDEVAATKVMIDRAEQTFDLKPKRLIADTAYGTGRFLGWLVKEKAVTPHIPVWDKSEREDGTFSRADFAFDKRRNVYICPAGCHAFLPEVGDEVGRVVALVGGQRQAALRTRILTVDHRERCLAFGLAGRRRRVRLHDEAVPVLDHRVAHEVELRRLTVALAIELRIRTGRALVRVVGALLAMELALTVAAR